MATSTNPYLGQNNPYLQQVIDLSSRDMVDNFNRTAVPAYNAAMVKSGSFGNSGIDELTRAGQSQLQQNLGDLTSKLRFNDYQQQQQMYQWDQGFDRALYNDAFSQNQQNLQTGIGLLGTLQGYNANDYTTATGVQRTPLDYLTQFSNLAGAAGRGGQTQSTTGGGSSPLTGALGGAQLGNAFSNWWNSNNSSNNIVSTPATGYSAYDGNGGGWDAWASYGSGAS